METGIWEVHALQYGRLAPRARAANFIVEDDHLTPMPLDYYVWLLRSADRAILVDTGFEQAEAERRGRRIDRAPHQALAALGLTPEEIDTVVVTHLHYDHAGGLGRYPNAQFHLQASEMAFATGPCMCHEPMRHPFSADHVCEMVRKVFSGRVIFHDGDGPVAEGVTVHHIGGHSRGLQAVRVRTREGWMCLASDAAHFYETWLKARPFPILDDMSRTLAGYRRIAGLASAPWMVIPGHDPLVRRIFPQGPAEFVSRLDVAPARFDPLAMGPG